MSASHTILKGTKGFKWTWYGSSIGGWGSHYIGRPWKLVRQNHPGFVGVLSESAYFFKGTIGCTPNGVPMVFIVLFKDSWDYNL